MTDRELLELAAKAAGLEFMWEELRYSGLELAGRPRARVPRDMAFPLWNPLTDDGDALRLAVKLGIGIYIKVGQYTDAAFRVGPESIFREQHNSDPDAATRRAIVRAAAEIGRTM